MIRPSSVSFLLIPLGVILTLSSAVHGQASYYTPGGAPGPGVAGPAMGYTGPGVYGMPPDTGPGAPGPIVARPFTAQPPRVLLGERMKQEDVNLEYVDVEAFTGVPITEDQIPRVNTLEEYRKVISEQVPAIFFDGEVYIYDEQDDAFKPRDWRIQEQNETLWAEIQYERQMAIRAQMQQRMAARTAAWRAQQEQMRAWMASQPGAGGPSEAAGRTVHVRGYTRKDGTYVRPHTRSAPRR